MADEVLEQTTEVAQTEEQTLETNSTRDRGVERNRDLSEKVTKTRAELDAEKQKRESAEKELEFYKGFSKLSSKYPNASDYEDKIREKVLKGYDMEDAAVAVLSKSGKLTMPKPEREVVAGGSATTNPSQGSKGIKEMTQAERLQALRDAEARGEIGLS